MTYGGRSVVTDYRDVVVRFNHVTDAARFRMWLLMAEEQARKNRETKDAA